MVGLFSTNW